MSCYNKKACTCNFNIKTYGVCDATKIKFNGSDRTALNWSEISVPEMLSVPIQKPDIENIDQVYVSTELTSAKLIKTPFAYNQYLILATPEQIALVTGILPDLTAVTATITPITDAVNALLLLLAGVVDQSLITGLTTVNNQILTASTDLTTAITNLTTTLALPNVTLSAICAAITAVSEALALLQSLLTQLTAVLTSILTTGGLDPIINAAIITAINLLINTTIGLATTAITTALDSILSIISICDKTIVIVTKPNAEGTCLSGRKIIIEGTLKQKVVYTANVTTQSVHSANFNVPFSAFIIPYANFENSEYTTDVPVLIDGVVTTVNGFTFNSTEEFIPNLCEEFSIDVCIEDIFAYAIDVRTIFKNITLFLKATSVKTCP